jgi:hypothetical protein
MRKIMSLLLLLISVFLFFGCKSTDGVGFSIEIDDTIFVNESKQINIVDSKSDEIFLYESSDDTIVNVSTNGLITGVSVGKAIITVKASTGKKIEVIIQVTPIVYIDKIQLELKSDGVIYAGVTYSYEVHYYPADSINKQVKFQKSDPNVQIDEENKTITFIRAGKSNIFLYLEDDWNIQTKLEVDVLYKEDSDVYDLLFVGNSLTKYTYNIPDMVKNMMILDGSIVYISYSTNYQYLDQHEDIVQKRLTEFNYTHVILQEKSDGLLTDYNRFYNSVQKYNNLIHTNGAKMVLYQTWAYNYNEIEERVAMQEVISNGYLDVSLAFDSMISRVGDVFMYVFLNHKEINLYNDLNHPSLYGAYLSALVHYKTITGNQAVESTYKPEGISIETAELLKQIVDVVID